jgi:hypothetical protein
MFERRMFHALFATTDQKEGMDAFVNKRKAVSSTNNRPGYLATMELAIIPRFGGIAQLVRAQHS